jgi:hypothetical protein
MRKGRNHRKDEFGMREFGVKELLIMGAVVIVVALILWRLL